MRCLFCKQPSTDSRSREHVIPESLGNTKLVLPPGVVCDGCNNYFARKVERPLLESPQVHYLRFEQAIPNKRGRVPIASGAVGGTNVQVVRVPSGPWAGVIQSTDRNIMQRLEGSRSCLEFSYESRRNATNRIWSRFIAKVALEAMAHRLRKHTDGLDYLVTEAQLDPLRSYARFDDGPTWPINSREIYCRDQPWQGLVGPEQRVWECDFLVTAEGEWYFVIAIFGQEFVINMGTRDLTGYRLWVWKHAHGSPLYGGDDIHDHGALRSRHAHPRGGKRMLVTYVPA